MERESLVIGEGSLFERFVLCCAALEMCENLRANRCTSAPFESGMWA